MATNLNDLNFTLVLFCGNAKIVRVPGNFLMHNPIRTLLAQWIDDTQTFYTHAEVEYRGSVVTRLDLADKQNLTRYS